MFAPGIIAMSMAGNIIASFAMMLSGIVTVLMFTEPISKYFTDNKKENLKEVRYEVNKK